jgi:hypothetical protein
MRELRTVDGFPVAEHDVVVAVAVDVIVVARAHRDRQLRGAVEQHDVARVSGIEGDRRQGCLTKPLVLDRGNGLRIVQGPQQQEGRAASVFAMM